MKPGHIIGIVAAMAAFGSSSSGSKGSRIRVDRSHAKKGMHTNRQVGNRIRNKIAKASRKCNRR